MAQFAERLALDLPDPLASHAELATHFLEGAGMAVVEAEPELYHFALALREAVEHLAELLLQHRERCSLGRYDGLRVLDEVTELGVLFLADRRLQRDGLLGLSLIHI